MYIVCYFDYTVLIYCTIYPIASQYQLSYEKAKHKLNYHTITDRKLYFSSFPFPLVLILWVVSYHINLSTLQKTIILYIVGFDFAHGMKIYLFMYETIKIFYGNIV